MRAKEHFRSDPEAYGVLLESARLQASTDWEEQFVADLKTNYDRWGLEAFVSEKQIGTLRRIAEGEEG